MKAIDHSIGAALQACALQAPPKGPQSLPAAGSDGVRGRGPGRGPARTSDPEHRRDRVCQEVAQIHLTSRQLDVLALLCEGLQNKKICRRLDIAPGTVKVHISSIFRALGVASRLAAVVEAQRRGLVKPEDVSLETRSRDILSRLLASGNCLVSHAQATQGATVAGVRPKPPHSWLHLSR